MASSKRNQPLRLVRMLEITAATTPMKTAGPAEMYPAAGVCTKGPYQLNCPHERAKGSHNRDESHDGSSAEPNGAPLLLEAVIHEHPRQTTHRTSEVRVDDREGRLDVGRERGTAVESEPADPEEDGAEEDVSVVCGVSARRRGGIEGETRTRCCGACTRDARYRNRDACLFACEEFSGSFTMVGDRTNSPR